MTAPPPSPYPFAYDAMADAIGYIAMSEADYRAASFLDQRLGAVAASPQWAAWSNTLAQMPALGRRDCGFIFHIGHVGSTLLSRLIGEFATILSLREPLPLRTLAQLHADRDAPESLLDPADLDRRRDGLIALLSRTYRPGQRSVVKATSFVGEIAPDLLAHTADPAAVLMTVAPETFLASILAGPASRQEARLAAQARLRRLHRRLGDSPWRLAGMGEGERIAMSWACEVTALMQAETVAGSRLLWLDFDALLADPPRLLAATLALFGPPADEAAIAAVLRGPVMTRYSKAPEHEYTPRLRRDVIAQARTEHGAEIAAGLRWLDRAAADHAPVAEARRRAG